MTLVRCVWTQTGTVNFKRSGVTGPAPSTDATFLTQAGVALDGGEYVVDWVASGETGSTVALAVQKQAVEGWVLVSTTGPYSFTNSTSRFDSKKNRPPGYKQMTFKLP